MRIEGIGKPDGCKLIRIQADIEAGGIKTIRIRGDFFASQEEEFEKVEQRLVGLSLEEVAHSFDRLLHLAGVEVFGISGDGLASVLFSALKNKETLL